LAMSLKQQAIFVWKDLANSAKDLVVVNTQ
jgi:hypothetical protein